MNDSIDYSRGILNPQKKKYGMVRTSSSGWATSFVEFYWEVFWDLPQDSSQEIESLPKPCVHLVFGQDGAEVVGPIESRRTTDIQGSGMVFGVKFWPGGFHPFLQASVKSLLNKRVPAANLFGSQIVELNSHILSRSSHDERISKVEKFLSKLNPEMDSNIDLINQIFITIENQRDLSSVEVLSEQVTMNKRTLQRLFEKYVGVSPKWALRLFRLQDAAEIMDTGERIDFSDLAISLGYADQAHFTNHFKKVTGRTPKSYLDKKTL